MPDESKSVIRPWLWSWLLLAWLLPDFTFPRVRSALFRQAGCRLSSGIAMMGRVRLIGSGPVAKRLTMGEGCVVAPGVTFGLDAEIRIGKRVSLSPGVTLYTATHGIGYGSQRMLPYTMAKPITIEDGVWIGMNALIMPGVTIGHGAVIAAGSVVSTAVPSDTLVSGNPATEVSKLPFGNR